MERVKRPSAFDTEDDLLCMQRELLKSKEMERKKSLAVEREQIRRVKKERHLNKEAGRFCIDLETLAEQAASTIQLAVQERNTEILHDFSRLNDSSDFTNCENYAKEDGFPEVLDLSRYYCDGVDLTTKLSTDGRSLFAMEFDRLHGRITDHSNTHAATSSASAELVISNIDEEIELENLQKIQKMSKQEVERAKEEIMERFDPKVLDFLRRRAKKKTAPLWKAKEIVPMPEQAKRSENRTNDIASNHTDNVNEAVADIVKQLEIFDVEKDKLTILDSSKAESLNDPYVRLAANLAQMDMATKCLRTIVPRQQQNLVRLFDNLLIPPNGYNGNDNLLEKARSNLHAIKGLYLEQRNDKSGDISVHFAEGINPFGSEVWMLCPIRKVLDVMHKDGKTTAQDLVIVRLTLLWTVLIMVERPSLFYAFVTPNEVFVRLAEIFLMGPEIFNDDCVSQCLERFLHDYLVPKAVDGRLCLVLKEPIGGLDAFEPFYEDLLEHFEEFSMSNDNFTLFILLGAYANQRSLDTLLMKCAIWAPRRNIVRQMTTKKDSGAFLLNFLARNGTDVNETVEKLYFAQYGQLLGMYAAAIRNSSIMRERNPLVYEIASRELGGFVHRHTTGKNHENTDAEIVKQCDALVPILRRSLMGYLDL